MYACRQRPAASRPTERFPCTFCLVPTPRTRVRLVYEVGHGRFKSTAAEWNQGCQSWPHQGEDAGEDLEEHGGAFWVCVRWERGAGAALSSVQVVEGSQYLWELGGETVQQQCALQCLEQLLNCHSSGPVAVCCVGCTVAPLHQCWRHTANLLSRSAISKSAGQPACIAGILHATAAAIITAYVGRQCSANLSLQLQLPPTDLKLHPALRRPASGATCEDETLNL